MKLRASAFPLAVVPLLVSLLSSERVLRAASNQAGSPAIGTATVQPPTNSPPADVPIPKAVFVFPATPQEGKDPFFPDSTRNYTGNTATKTNKAVIVSEVALKGVFFMAKRPLATINNHTFEVGEEGDVITGTGRLRIRCLEVREDSVLIEVGGERRELRLPRGK
jgi:hypothetical protein